MDVAQSTPQGAHCHVAIIYFLPELRIMKGAWSLWFSELDQHQLGALLMFFIPRWIKHFGFVAFWRGVAKSPPKIGWLLKALSLIVL